MDASIKFKDINDFNENLAEIGFLLRSCQDFNINCGTSDIFSGIYYSLTDFIEEYIYSTLKDITLRPVNFSKIFLEFSYNYKHSLTDFLIGDTDLNLICEMTKQLSYIYIFKYLDKNYKLNKITILKILIREIKTVNN